MRNLEHGDKVKMVMSDYQTLSVDTPQDLEKVVKLMEDDRLRLRY
jgi:3-deoxy-manno-octulosonate cytidylyltransferase (CMP-KDO synthetase)